MANRWTSAGAEFVDLVFEFERLRLLAKDKSYYALHAAIHVLDVHDRRHFQQ